ncbi:MAG: HEPN domain-containing protein [Ignavibacteria bacterium]|nr:HEPN domain-containing protein [Ignavibacteria bacterium]
MVRKSSRTKYDRNDAVKFKRVAENFIEGAKLAYEFEYYNAAGVLVVHAAIALADYVTIYLKGEKCKGDNHFEILNLIKEITFEEEKRTKAIKNLESILHIKSSVSYTGEIYTKSDIEKLFQKYTKFESWVKIITPFL